jgi:PIN domain nuclease of toxin-antitoxin system
MLIDTHVLIWMFERQTKFLGPTSLQRLETERVVVSCVSLIEMAVKKRKGKLDMPDTASIVATLRLKDIDVLDIQTKYIAHMPSLEQTPHADPFDLLLVAQAISEGIPLLTCDAEILKINQPGLRLIDGRQ